MPRSVAFNQRWPPPAHGAMAEAIHSNLAATAYPHEAIEALASKLIKRGVGEAFARNLARNWYTHGAEWAVQDVMLLLNECAADVRTDAQNKAALDLAWQNLAKQSNLAVTK